MINVYKVNIFKVKYIKFVYIITLFNLKKIKENIWVPKRETKRRK